MTQGVVLVFICVMTLTGNLLFWVTIVRYHKLRTSPNMLLLSLSAADLVVAAVNMPITTYTVFVGR